MLFEITALEKRFSTMVVEASDATAALTQSWITEFDEAELVGWRVVEIRDVESGAVYAVDAYGVVARDAHPGPDGHQPLVGTDGTHA